MKLIFWQNSPSIHQTPLLNALVDLGMQVYQFYEKSLSQDRINMGWNITNTRFISIPINELTMELRSSILDADVHIFSGFGSFPMVAQELVKQLKINPRKIFVFVERPDCRGLNGVLRRLLYQFYLIRFRKIAGILAAGSVQYFRSLFYAPRILPFIYYTEDDLFSQKDNKENEAFNIAYVGSLIPRKNIITLFQALQQIEHKISDESIVVHICGDGVLKEELKKFALTQYSRVRVQFHGNMGNENVQKLLNSSDCLILSSWHDGYGAVVNEALLAGCRVICSSAVGASETLMRLGYGENVFCPSRPDQLANILFREIQKGTVTLEERLRSITIAESLRPAKGAELIMKYIREVVL